MKKRLVLAGFIGFTFLFGCSQISNEVNADGDKGMTLVSKSDGNYIYKHKKTGCYYLRTKLGYSGGVVQMMVEKDGVTVPYCEGGKN